MGLALENIGQRDGRSAHIAVFGSSLVELPQVYRAAADRHDLIEVDIGLLPAPRRVEDIADTERLAERRHSLFLRLVMAAEAFGLLPDTLHSFVVFLRGVGSVNIPGTLHPRRPCRNATAVTALKPDQLDKYEAWARCREDKAYEHTLLLRMRGFLHYRPVPCRCHLEYQRSSVRRISAGLICLSWQKRRIFQSVLEAQAALVNKGWNPDNFRIVEEETNNPKSEIR